MILNEERYRDLDNEQVRQQVDRLISLWYDFLADNKETLKQNVDYFVHERNLFEVINRTDKRKVYYHIFHKIDYENVNEYKEIAIMCYWINTLKPFMVTKSNSDIYNAPNEMFSLYLIFSVLGKVYKNLYKKDIPEIPETKIRDYIYTFKYCDLSREATIQFVDMLASVFNVGTDIVLNNNEKQ